LPREVAIFDDFYLVITRRKIDGVVGGGGEAIVDVDRGGFGGRGGREEAGSLDKRALVEADFVATSQEGDKIGSGDYKKGNSQEKK